MRFVYLASLELGPRTFAANARALTHRPYCATLPENPNPGFRGELLTPAVEFSARDIAANVKGFVCLGNRLQLNPRRVFRAYRPKLT
jgi:hypothetical protein